ncbi:MAG: hypothetical protein HY710_13530, partial [Candidatus Latescibacteria bacterium]|nr:hypothetical protein [Candidatus Latescibacterota bacterium]
MRSNTRFWLLIGSLVFGLSLPAVAGQPISGTRRVATQRATVHVQQLARQGVQAPAVPRTPQAIRSPLPAPRPSRDVPVSRPKPAAPSPASPPPLPLPSP